MCVRCKCGDEGTRCAKLIYGETPRARVVLYGMRGVADRHRICGFRYPHWVGQECFALDRLMMMRAAKVTEIVDDTRVISMDLIDMLYAGFVCI